MLNNILGEREIQKTEMIIRFILSLVFFLCAKKNKLLELKGSRDFTQPKSVPHVVSALKCNSNHEMCL